MKTNADITIYSRYLDLITKVDKYQRTVLMGVFWESYQAVNVRKSGLDNADRVRVFIPHQVAVIGDYRKPKAWQALGDKAGFWTLQTGDKVVLGAVDYEIEKVASELEKRFDDVLTLTKIDDKNFGSLALRHWEVGGV